MELPEGIEWPQSVEEYEEKAADAYHDGSDPLRYADAAIADLIEMVRRFYWQRNELLRLHTAYPKVMKEKLELEWEKRQ